MRSVGLCWRGGSGWGRVGEKGKARVGCLGVPSSALTARVGTGLQGPRDHQEPCPGIQRLPPPALPAIVPPALHQTPLRPCAGHTRSELLMALLQPMRSSCSRGEQPQTDTSRLVTRPCSIRIIPIMPNSEAEFARGRVFQLMRFP